MDYTQYTAVKNRFIATPNLCDLFKLLAIETWKRIEYAYLKSGVKVFETTITQNLIFSINAYNDQYNLNIDIFEALDENKNGNDFELIIRFPADGVCYYAPIQAKKIYRTGKYNSIDHGVQIESLLDYGNKMNAKPFYLLYNFTTNPIKNGVTLTTPKELTGCTMVSAEYLFRNHYNQRRKRNGALAWIIPDFYDLNPNEAFPWHELVCPNNALELYNKLLNKNGLEENQVYHVEDLVILNNNLKQGFYPLDSFEQDKGWINVKELNVNAKEDTKYFTENTNLKQSQKGYQLETISNKSSREENVYSEFSPKCRIIINK